jgi:site-specific DNA recombinase
LIAFLERERQALAERIAVVDLEGTPCPYSGSVIQVNKRGGEPPVRLENAWPAIIDRETFQHIKGKMSSNAPRSVHPRIVPSFYLLSGLLFCSCGSAMIGRSAKSHQYYYYDCNTNNKQGKDACSARSLPKDKLENVVIGQIKEKILTRECLEDLVKLVNEELDSANIIFRDRFDAVDAELNDVKARLLKLYDALETGKLNLDDLSPRIKELRMRQDELNKTKLKIEAEMVVHGAEHVDIEVVKSYAQDLRSLLEETDSSLAKAFLRSFVKRIEIDGDKVVVQYNLPILLEEGKQLAGVLPIDTPSGAEGIRTPDLLRAREALSQLSYSPR